MAIELNPTQAGCAGKDPIQEAKANTSDFNQTLETETKNTGDMAYYLQLQREMMKEQQAFTAVSNVMKARSEAALNAIRNVRS